MKHINLPVNFSLGFRIEALACSEVNDSGASIMPESLLGGFGVLRSSGFDGVSFLST
jgi:hypothetical protein